MDTPTKQNGYRTPLRQIAMLIKQRTTNPNHNSYHNYGGRGIRMCEEWAKDYGKFEEYCLANGWQKGLQIDRIDNNGHYEPGNVRFVTPMENLRNTRSNVLNPDKVKEIHVMRAKGMTQQAIADHFGISSPVVSNVLTGRLWKDIHPDPELLKGHPEVNPRAIKLTPEIVREIHKAIHLEGIGCKKIAKRFGLKGSAISNIRNGKIWNSIWREFNQPQQEAAAA